MKKSAQYQDYLKKCHKLSEVQEWLKRLAKIKPPGRKRAL